MARQDQLKVGGLTIRGVAQGGVETCLRVPELRLMFDVGLCPAGATSTNTILVTHGHADHMAGLPYLISNRAMVGAKPPQIHIPEEIEQPLRTILECWGTIEGFEPQYELFPHPAKDRFALGKGLYATTLRASHRVPCLGYAIERVSQRLKPEYHGLSGPEISELRGRGTSVTEGVSTPLLCVSGDTTIEFFIEHALARTSKVLVHEVTAWDDRRDVERTRLWGHTHVDEMIAHADKFEGEALVLVHRSLRHSRNQAETIVRERFPASVRDRVHVFGY